MEELTYKTIQTMRSVEAAGILRDLGIHITPDMLIRGIQQGQYPFGNVIVGENGNRECFVYKKLLDEWIDERIIEVKVRRNGLSSWTPKGEPQCSHS